MREANDMHGPLLINSIGHSVGFLLFAGFLILVLRDKRTLRSSQGKLSAIIALLALLWNSGSLIVLAAASGLFPSSDWIPALSFSVLSLLPAVLLHLSLDGNRRPIWIFGYVLSGVAVCLHLAELALPDSQFHITALWLVILGFGALTALAMIGNRHLFKDGHRQASRRIVVSMCLFVFAISFIHFGSGHPQSAWSSEIALHHAGIPLALYVLLQDYRFLLLDAFLRFAVNSIVAAAAILISLGLNSRFQILRHAEENTFLQGVLLATACLVVMLLILIREKLQVLLTRVVFGRRDRESAVYSIRGAGGKAATENVFLQNAAEIMASFASAAPVEVREVPDFDQHDLPLEPVTIAESIPQDKPLWGDREWIDVAIPVRFTKGDGALILLGRREGGRRYLSEDLRELARLAAVIVEQIERLRSSEMLRLVSQAELRALQSQINPHFLFNSLNTLYGSIPREAREARGMVLNLAEIFRYYLNADRTFIPLAEELQLVRAYLQIEAMRLGDRLQIEVEMEERAGRALIPILSIQPLVENAVKHGVAARPGPGKVRISAKTLPGGVRIEVSDNGGGFQSGKGPKPASGGVGLDNVRQRLLLCFGESANLQIESTSLGSTIRFMIPTDRTGPMVLQEVSA